MAGGQPFTHDWRAPGVEPSKLPSPPPINSLNPPAEEPLPLELLKFNPLGLYDLRRRLGVYRRNPNVWNKYSDKFTAADLAWLAHGASNDGQHHPAASAGFFPEFEAFRASVAATPAGYTARRQFMDKATLYDRTAGSSTMIMNVQGTTQPGLAVVPENLRAHVYIPPLFLRRNPGSHLAIAQIVQHYIESVGVPTVTGWASDARANGWHLTQTAYTHQSHPDPNAPLVPRPKTVNSASYVFHGRPVGSLDTPPTTSITSISPSTSQSSSRYGSEDLEEYSADALALISSFEEIARLEARVAQLQSEVDGHYAQEDDSAEQIRELEAFVQTLQEQLARAQVLRAPQSPRPPASPRPPTYTPSQPFSTPIRGPSIRSPGPSATPSASPINPAPTFSCIRAFLTKHDSLGHIAIIRMMVKHVAVEKWAEEISQMGFGRNATELLECVKQDCLM
ncbi:hypothetical protein C8R43DRAFT_1122484 [Mycena crocata]|nr:hypothetical protein C8R43DRAFT_1122484 [Mycena crocata]